MLLDPGIGFGKTIDAQPRAAAAARTRSLRSGARSSVGTSRKSFLGRIAGDGADARRLPGTIATNVLALERGASVFRVHDVAPVREALEVAAATLGGRWTTSTRATIPTS